MKFSIRRSGDWIDIPLKLCPAWARHDFESNKLTLLEWEDAEGTYRLIEYLEYD